MLSQKTLQAIADKLKIKAEDLVSAVKSEKDVDLEISELTVFSSEELKLHDENLKKTGYENAKTAGEEMLIKSLKEKTGIKIEGKDPDKFIEALKTQILEEAKIEPDKKISELQSDIQKLKDNLKASETEKQALTGQIKESSLQQKIFAGLTGETLLPATDIYTLMKGRGYAFTEEDGKIVVSQFGKVLKNDKTLEPLSGIDLFNSFVDENNLAKTDPKKGRGEKTTSSTDGILNIKDLRKKYESEGKSILGEEYMAEAQKLAKDNKEFFNE